MSKKVIGIVVEDYPAKLKPAAGLMQLMRIYQGIYDANPTVGNKLLAQNPIGAMLLEFIPDFNERKFKKAITDAKLDLATYLPEVNE